MAINRQSGEVTTVIPGIAGIYEGARQRIYSVSALGAQISTGIGDGKIWMNLCKVNADNDGNFVLLSEDGMAIYLYNPNGLVGYNKARGTVIKLK